MLAIGNITDFAVKKLQHFYTKNDPKEGKLESYLTVSLPCLALPCLVLSCLILSYLILSYLILSYLICPINK